jgi:polyisoprenoid-binding protein YceI
MKLETSSAPAASNPGGRLASKVEGFDPDPDSVTTPPNHPRRLRMRNRSLLVVAAVLFPALAQAKTFTVDPDHSSVGFGVRHLFTEVQGRFTQYKGTVVFDPAKPEEAKVEGSVQAASVDTDVDQRDEDLRSANFFDVAKYPEIKFESTKVTDINKADNTAKVHGNRRCTG